MQRCLSMIRRNATLVSAGGVLLVGVYSAAKELLLSIGNIETDLAHVTSSKIGNYSNEYYSHSVLLARLIKYRKFFRYNIWNTRDAAVASRLDTAIVDMETDISDGALRKQPYCVVLYGHPGTGKSSFAIQIAKALMTSRYGEFKSTDFVTLNETDEYQSEFRTSHKVVLFDDIGASSEEKPDTTNPWRKVIDFVNNVKKTALNPNCEMKGKVYITPDLVVLTTNINFSVAQKSMKTWIPCYGALLRRFNKIILVENFLHASELIYMSGGQPASEAGKMQGSPRVYRLERPVSRPYLVAELVKDFTLHMEDQQIFVDSINDNFDDITIDYELPYSSVLDSQSGSDISISDRRRKYYSKIINFANYYVGHCAAMSKNDGATYYLDGDIIVTSRSRTSIDVHIDDFNYCYQQYLLSQDQLLSEVILHAEGKAEYALIGAPERFRINPFCFEVDTLEYIKYLILHDVKCMYNYHTNIRIGNYGEIDMMITLDQVTLVIECKQAFDLEFLHKGVSQVDKYTDVAEILRPDDRIIGLLYSPVGFTVVCDNRKPVVEMGFKNFLDRIFYNWEGHSPAKNVMREVNEK